VKKELRTKLRSTLAALGADEIHARSARAAQLLIQQPEYQRAEIVMTYLSLPLEADTTSVVLHAWQMDKRVLAPLVSWEARQMIPVEINSLDDDLIDGPMGVRQPVRGDPIPVGIIDLVIVPGLGFDAFGNRLGRGRGFYDRFLAQATFHGVACGFGLEEQVVASIPEAAHDMPIDMLVTDERVHRFDSARRSRADAAARRT
jgi:5-formyltetrahydrofolate cyclo-ligase